MLVDSLDQTKNKCSKAQEVILKKQLEYFKERNEVINETQMKYG
jgi:hypothetical protein